MANIGSNGNIWTRSVSNLLPDQNPTNDLSSRCPGIHILPEKRKYVLHFVPDLYIFSFLLNQIQEGPLSPYGRGRSDYSFDAGGCSGPGALVVGGCSVRGWGAGAVG